MKYVRGRRSIKLDVGDTALDGELTLPPEATGLVVFANGQWGVRYASTETDLARALNEQGFGTLLMELLTPAEAAERSNRFSTGMLAERLTRVTEWLERDESTAELDLGFLGVGPGAATALATATRPGVDARAVVSLNGRLDLVADDQQGVTVPTLLVVDGDDDHLLRSNRKARERLGGERRHVVLWTGRSERDVLDDEIATLATTWFRTHFGED